LLTLRALFQEICKLIRGWESESTQWLRRNHKAVAKHVLK
jgi:hypothetical protein